MADPATDTMQALVIEAMARLLDDKKRDELIRQALAALLEKRSFGYGAASSQIEREFQGAVTDVARTIVREIIETDELKARIRDLASKAIERALLDETTLVDRIARAFGKALSGE